jgi:hypothetical protein
MPMKPLFLQHFNICSRFFSFNMIFDILKNDVSDLF